MVGAAEPEGGGRNDWRFTVGARNRRVQAALSTEPRADGEDPRYVLGAMLLAAWLYQARAKGPWRPLHGVALYRLLALVYAHADAPAR